MQHPPRLLPILLSAVASAFFSFLRPAFAGCDNFAPTTGQSVVCDTSIEPNPATTSIIAAPQSTDVSVTINAGAEISTFGAAIRIQNNSRIENNGTVTANGNFGYGIWTGDPGNSNSTVVGFGNTFINNGIISTQGANAVALYARTSNSGSGNSLVNNGIITTFGSVSGNTQSAAGIRVETVAPSEITNTGMVTASGTGANGIEMIGPGTIINTGTGEVTSVASYGILGGNVGITVDNAGKVSGSLGAVILGAGADTLIVRAGSNIAGSIDGGGAGNAGIGAQDTLIFSGFVASAFDNPLLNWGLLTTTNNASVILTAPEYQFNSIRIDAGSSLGFSDSSLSVAVGIVNDGNLSFSVSAQNNFAGIISGAGSFTKHGAGNLTLSGKSTYSGDTIIEDGTLSAGGTNIFSPGSFYQVMSRGTLNLLGNDQTIAGLSNAGIVDTGKTPGTLLTVSGTYTSNGGRLLLSSVIGGDNSLSSKLIADRVILGSRATTLFVTNVGGLGARTIANGIQVIRVNDPASSAKGAFVLGKRVAAGAYSYNLYQGGIGGASSDGNWYLRSMIGAAGDDAGHSLTEIPNYRAEVPVDMAAPALANRFGLTMLGTYHDRVSDGYGYAPGSKDEGQLASWGRLFGETGNVGYGGSNELARFNKFEKNGPSYDFNIAGFQAGMDLWRRQYDNGMANVGAYIGAGRIDSDVKAVLGGPAGSVSMDGYSGGIYWTYHGTAGWYVDAVAQGTMYNSIEARSILGEKLTTNGWGLTTSLEGGYSLSLGGGWAIEPQMQLIYQRISIGDTERDSYGQIKYGDTDMVYGRLGSRLTKNWILGNGRTLTTWARINIWHSFGADAKTTFLSLDGGNPVALKTSLGGIWTQLGFGISGQVAENVSVFVSGDYNLSRGDSRGFGGHAGLKVLW